jgi:hypothetical protein
VEESCETAEEVEAYFLAHPDSLAARVRPLAVRAGAGWQVCHGPRIRDGGSVFGWTVTAAFESWEANYRQAATAQQ